jgi:hypothetical protein
LETWEERWRVRPGGGEGVRDERGQKEEKNEPRD